MVWEGECVDEWVDRLIEINLWYRGGWVFGWIGLIRLIEIFGGGFERLQGG